MLYSLQGQRYKINNNLEYNQRNEYVKVPVYFSYSWNATKKFALVGKAGPQINFLINSKLDDKDGNSIIVDTKNRYNDVTFGGMTSIGAHYKINSNFYLTGPLDLMLILPMQRNYTYVDYVNGR